MYLIENLNNLLQSKLKTLNRLRPLSPSLVAKLKEKFEIEMTYNSNSIEGNTLTLKETYLVIQHGVTVKGKSLKDHLEAKNHKEALDYLYELIEHKKNNTISHHLIKSLHTLIIQDINKNIAGQYRKLDVFISGSNHTPPSALDVQIKMDELINWAQVNFNKMNIIDFSAIFHHKFVHIHPFEDGNGRVGRLLMNIFLMNYGFPLAIIQTNDRHKYYRALSFADDGDYKILVNFVGQSVLRSLDMYLNVLTLPQNKEKVLTLAEASKYFKYSQAYLGKLAKDGKIDAYKEKRNWVTTKEAIQKYIKEHS